MYKIKNLIKKIVFFILYRDNKIYYGDNHNSLNFLHLFFWNFISPGRMLTRIKYNRFLLPRRIKKIDNNVSLDVKNLSNKEIIEISAAKLKKYGTVILNQYFSESVLSRFEEEYKSNFEELNYQPADSYSNSDKLPLSKNLADLWFDEIVINIIEKYIKRLPFARSYPMIQSTTPKHTDLENDRVKSETKFPDRWHLDHSTLVQAAIYFTDVEEGDSHTQVLCGSHTYPNVTNPINLSNEYIKKNNLTVKKCFGKRGSVQIHCGNVFHRFQAKQNTTRTWIKFEYSSGNNLDLDSQYIAKMLKNDFNLSSLDSKSRSIVSCLFPIKLYKGYEINKKSFKPSKFRNI